MNADEVVVSLSAEIPAAVTEVSTVEEVGVTELV